MIKRIQKVKIFIIFCILSFSLFIISPIGKSSPLHPLDPIYECNPRIILEYNETLIQKPIIPYGQPRAIPIIIKVKIEGPTADIVLGFIGGELFVYLSIAEVSEGCHASINPPILNFSLSNEFKSLNATLSLTIDQYLPAFSLKNVKVRMKSDSLGFSTTLVKEGNYTQDIPFYVGYYPQLSFSYPENNVKSIGPDKIAHFTIEIQNWGNAGTKIITEIEDMPKDWHADIVKNTTLGTNLTSISFKGTISLNIKPPISFGYHEDREIIKVKMTPEYVNNSEYKGEPYYLYFIVQSNGFSTPGFEMITIFLAFFIILLPILKRKNKKKIEKKYYIWRKK